MKIKLYSIEQVEAFITNANTLLGYPDGNGTETYCNVPEITEITENDVVIDSYYEIDITQELIETRQKRRFWITESVNIKKISKI